jgi:hypothetical protein
MIHGRELKRIIIDTDSLSLIVIRQSGRALESFRNGGPFQRFGLAQPKPKPAPAARARARLLFAFWLSGLGCDPF